MMQAINDYANVQDSWGIVLDIHVSEDFISNIENQKIFVFSQSTRLSNISMDNKQRLSLLRGRLSKLSELNIGKELNDLRNEWENI